MDNKASSSEIDVTLNHLETLLKNLFPWLADREVWPTTSLRNDLNIDSLHMVELQIAIEDHFGLQLDPLDERLTDAFLTVGHLARYLHMLKEGRNT